MNRSALILMVGAWVLAGCATQAAYEGALRPRSETAVIVGAPRVNAGLPLAPVLRKVDDRVITWENSRVAVLPGEHRLLVDCVMGRSTARFELFLDAKAGRAYVLIAESAAGNQYCGGVRLEER
jgi:hypothetical protein